MKRFTLIFISFLYIVSCTQSYYRVLSPYKNKKIKTGKFAIISPIYNFSEDLQTDIDSTFGNKNTNQLCEDFLNDKLIRALYLESNYDKSIYAPDLPIRKAIMEFKNFPPKTNLAKRELTIHDTLKINLMLPKDSETIEFLDKVDYVLVMDTIKMFYSTDTNFVGGMSFIPGATFSTPTGSITTPGTFVGGGGSGPRDYLYKSTQYTI